MIRLPLYMAPAMEFATTVWNLFCVDISSVTGAPFPKGRRGLGRPPPPPPRKPFSHLPSPPPPPPMGVWYGMVVPGPTRARYREAASRFETVGCPMTHEVPPPPSPELPVGPGGGGCCYFPLAHNRGHRSGDAEQDPNLHRWSSLPRTHTAVSPSGECHRGGRGLSAHPATPNARRCSNWGQAVAQWSTLPRGRRGVAPPPCAQKSCTMKLRSQQMKQVAQAAFGHVSKVSEVER